MNLDHPTELLTENMSHDLTNSVALITGGGRGLGRVIAGGLSKLGARVVITARSQQELDDTVNWIRADNGNVDAVRADVADRSDVGRLREEVLKKFGPPRILINAAGTFGPIQLIQDSSIDAWIGSFETNMFGPYLVCRAFLKPMIDAGWGRIINFSSAATLHPPGPLNSAYATSKVALNQFTRHLAAELQTTEVTANVIHPGEVKTAMWAEIQRAAETAGPLAQPLRDWAKQVGIQGGDDPQRAFDLVLEIIRGKYSQASGKFLWIEGGQQPQLTSWD